MEVAALGFQASRISCRSRHAGGALAEGAQLVREVDQLLGYDVDDEALALDLPAHLEKLRGHDDAAVPLEDLRPDHNVDDAGLVLEREEDHALGGAGPLAHQHQTGNGDAPARRTIVPVRLAGDDAAAVRSSRKKATGCAFSDMPMAA